MVAKKSESRKTAGVSKVEEKRAEETPSLRNDTCDSEAAEGVSAAGGLDGEHETAHGEPYIVAVVTDRNNVKFVNLREEASSDADIDHSVAVGSMLKAVADLGEWTMLKCGLYIMSKYVRKL